MSAVAMDANDLENVLALVETARRSITVAWSDDQKFGVDPAHLMTALLNLECAATELKNAERRFKAIDAAASGTGSSEISAMTTALASSRPGAS
jgi:hypothetical protein